MSGGEGGELWAGFRWGGDKDECDGVGSGVRGLLRVEIDFVFIVVDVIVVVVVGLSSRLNVARRIPLL